ncbi:unnamed protein product, partial [Mesorhabditis spiculigera]
MKPLLGWLFLLVLAWTGADAYKLNVPRLLFPYHPTVPMHFDLEVGSPSGGCFKWRSNRPDIVQVEPASGECSDRARVVSSTKVGGTHSAVIFAEESGSGTTLSCVVTIDEVATITIEHTTKVLYVDAAPARITAVAFNADGDKFSTLGQLPFEWELATDNGAETMPLRIVPFEQSKYRAPQDIQALEKAKKKGYLVLLEGLVTGSSAISARFQDPHFKNVPTNTLDLVVVANLLLEPAQDLYVPTNSDIAFTVKIVKERGLEDVPMPSPLYTLKLDNEDCKLNSKTSTVTAVKKGKSMLSLNLENVDPRVTSNAAVRPPSTRIFIVDPESLQFAVAGSNWLLERGRTYRINVNLLDPHGNHMFIADNARFETVFPHDYFDIKWNTKNATWFEVTPKKSGRVNINSRLNSFITEGGIEVKIKRKVDGEQEVEIVDPITVAPDQIVLPFLTGVKFNYPLTASGGSGTYSWATEDRRIGTIHEATGMVTSGQIGWTAATATDRRNPAHSGKSTLGVLEIVSLDFGKTRKEAEEGKILFVNVQLFGIDRTKGHRHYPFTDCRNIPFVVEVQNRAHFVHVPETASTIPSEGTGCATIALRAVRSGDTRVTVKYDKYSATIDISAFPALKVDDDLLVPVGGAYKLNTFGGPRPWLLDNSQFFVNGVSQDKVVTVKQDDEQLTMACSGKEGSTEIKLSVGNNPTSSNEIPAVISTNVRVCCGRPIRMALGVEGRTPSSKDYPKCPNSVKTVFASAPFQVGVRLYGRCGSNEEERVMSGIGSLDFTWSLGSGKDLLALAKETKHNEPATLAFVDGYPNGKVGDALINNVVTKVGSHRLPQKLTASLELKLVKRATPVPSSLVLWNDPTAAATIKLNGGSGHYHLIDRSTFYDALISDGNIKVSPKKIGQSPLRLVDICIDSSEIVIPVKITDIKALKIQGPQYLEVTTDTEVEVHVVDADDEPFSAEYVSVMGLELTSSNTHVKVERQNGMKFRIRGQTVGEVALVAAARSSGAGAIRSRQHMIQVFAPMRFQPKIVTLVPESTFQLEVIGGPRPTPPISFSTNTSRHMNIAANALITSKNELGYTLVTGTIQQSDGRSTTDSVLVKVVSLASIRIRVSSNYVEAGGKVWARIDGMLDDETPYSFGGAEWPLKVNWSLGDASVLSLDSSKLGTALEEPEQNRFSISLNAKNAGKGTIKVQVEMHPSATRHFQGKSRIFNAEATITVDEAPALADPNMPLTQIRIAPDTEYKLLSKW